MRQFNQDKNILYCFSPFVMLATFFIETLLALYVFFRYGLKTPTRRIIFVLLLFLAIFQFVEYNICQTHSQAMINLFARIGFIAITFLPALGVHLSSALARRKNPWYVGFAYFLAGLWAFFFGIYDTSIIEGICGANYAIFDLPERVGLLYGIYYFGLLVVGVWESYTLAHRKKFKKHKKSLLFLVAGYLFFMIPTGIAVIVHPAATDAIPSIMCGFALALACVLVLFVLPISEKE